MLRLRRGQAWPERISRRRPAGMGGHTMKRILAGLTAALLMLAGMTTAAEDYRIAEDNTDGFAALLIDLVDAYEAPSAEDAARLEGDLSAIRAVSEADYEIASAIAARSWPS